MATCRVRSSALLTALVVLLAGCTSSAVTRPKQEVTAESYRNETAKGFVVLNWIDAGWVHFFTQKPVATPDDLKALKLFSWAGDAKSVEVWRSAGFNPVPLPSTELYTALQTGLVEAELVRGRTQRQRSCSQLRNFCRTSAEPSRLRTDRVSSGLR